MSGKRDFLSQPAPENYVAGLGRGATGFTTRSDLGSAPTGPTEEQLQENIAKRAAQLGTAAPAAYGGQKRKAEEEDQYEDAENEEGLLARGNYDQDDKEADEQWRGVDEMMAKRRKRQREAREAKEREEYERNNPKIQQQFADLKRALATVTDEEWANLPDAGDHTGKNRRSKQNSRQRFYAVPDSVLVGARDAGQLGTEIQDDGAATADEQGDGTMTNFASIGAARDKLLQVRLDQAAKSQVSDEASGTSTNVDQQGYLTSLDKHLKNGLDNVGDIKRARQLLESVIRANPKHAPGWIAAARLEEHSGKIVSARNVIRRGCENCPNSEDAWLENMRLHREGSNQNAKVIAAEAIQNNNKSVPLWLEAMKLESLPANKKRVLRKAIDHLPSSVALWKEAVNLEEDPANAKLLLAKAVEILPLSVELWLALARLESPDQAQAILNKARRNLPTSSEIWIAAARLQEQAGQGIVIPRMMERAVLMLKRESAGVKRESWIAQAETCEVEGAPITCRAIIHEALGWGLEKDDDRMQTWLEDAQRSIDRDRIETARAMYALTTEVFYNQKIAWLAAASLERQHGTKDQLFGIFEKAIKAAPNAVEVWMTYSQELIRAQKPERAREVLEKAFQANSESEEIYLEAVKLEADSGDPERARELLTTAREQAYTDRLWTRSVAFERQRGDNDHALALVNEGLQLFPKNSKMWMMKGQIYEDKGMVQHARETYNAGTRSTPKSAPLWLLLSRLEEKHAPIVKARSILDRARLACPKSPDVWAETVRLEMRAGNKQAAEHRLAQAMQQCPNSGTLWNVRIWNFESRTHRKPRILEAIKQVPDDPMLFVTAAKIFWLERKLEKADDWFGKAMQCDPDYGDTWAWWYKFLLKHGTADKRAEVMRACVMYAPKHGEEWAKVKKNPKNARKSTEEILQIVVDGLQLEGDSLKITGET